MYMYMHMHMYMYMYLTHCAGGAGLGGTPVASGERGGCAEGAR